MTEWEKMISGVLYDPTDPAIAARARHCRELLYDFNHSRECFYQDILQRRYAEAAAGSKVRQSAPNSRTRISG